MPGDWHGLAADIRLHYSPARSMYSVGLLLIANTINMAADVGQWLQRLSFLLAGCSLVCNNYCHGIVGAANIHTFPQLCTNSGNIDIIALLYLSLVRCQCAVGEVLYRTIMPSYQSGLCDGGGCRIWHHLSALFILLASRVRYNVHTRIYSHE